MRTRRILLSVWIFLCCAFVIGNVVRTLYVGSMPLPPVQALTLSLCIVLALNLVLSWIWMAIWYRLKRHGLVSSHSWVDHPVAHTVLLALLVVALPLLIYARYVEPRWVAVRTISLGERPPDGVRPVRIAVVSDIHAADDREPLSSLADRVNATDPDVILFLGDALNRGEAIDLFNGIMSRMRAPYGKYAVRGNWDVPYWGHASLLADTGFVWLDGMAVSLRIRGQPIHLVGYPFRDEEPGGEEEAMVAALPAEEWRLFLYHTPDLIEHVPSADLYLAGHTHGGQIALPWYGALVTFSRYGKRFERGMSAVGQNRIYVTTGIGVEPILPLRFCARPEIAVFELGPLPRKTAPLSHATGNASRIERAGEVQPEE